MSIYLSKFKQYKLSQIFFWLFLISLPFNKRIIYQPETAYIDGYFSYYLAIFLYLSDILLFICFTAFLVENWAYLRQNLEKQFSRISLLVLAFIASATIGWFHVKHPGFLPFYSLIKILEFILLTWYVAFNVNIKSSTIILYISGIFQAILGIWQFHVQHSVGFGILGEYVAPLGIGGLASIDTMTGKVIRAYGTFPHPNILGAFLIVSLIFGYWFVSRETEVKQRICLEIGNFLLILGIFLTFSRVAWVVAAAATLAFTVYNWQNDRIKRAGTLVFVAIVTCATILSLWHGLLFGRITDISGSNSYIDRGTYNHWGLEVVKTHPIFGTGIGNYIPTIMEFHPPSLGLRRAGVQPWKYQPSHNIFIYVGATTGLVGLALFLYFLWKIFRSTWNSNRTDLRFVLLMLGGSLIFMSLFDHFLVTIQQGQLLFFTALGLMLGFSKLNTRS